MAKKTSTDSFAKSTDSLATVNLYWWVDSEMKTYDFGPLFEGKLLGRGGGHFQEPSRNMMKLRACLTYDPSRADTTLSQLWGREIDVEISTWTNPAWIHALVDRKFYNAGVSEPSTTHSQRMLWHINICANKNLSSRAFCWPNVFLFHQY